MPKISGPRLQTPSGSADLIYGPGVLTASNSGVNIRTRNISLILYALKERLFLSLMAASVLHRKAKNLTGSAIHGLIRKDIGFCASGIMTSC